MAAAATASGGPKYSGVTARSGKDWLLSTGVDGLLDGLAQDAVAGSADFSSLSAPLSSAMPTWRALAISILGLTGLCAWVGGSAGRVLRV